MSDHEKQCPVCGKLFTGIHNVCSNGCRKKYRLQKKLQIQPDHERKCPVCGEMFTGSPNKLYCSKKCSKKHRLKQEIQRNTRSVICATCGETFTTSSKDKNRNTCPNCIRKTTRAHNQEQVQQQALLEIEQRHKNCNLNTSAFDDHYKRASYDEYIHSADFNLGF